MCEPKKVDVRRVSSVGTRLVGAEFFTVVSSERMTVNVVRLAGFNDPHIHVTHDEAIYFVEGNGGFLLGDEVLPVETGQLVFVPAGTPHTPIVDKEALVISVFSPSLDPTQPDRKQVPRDGEG